MYTEVEFGKELKQKVLDKAPVSEIGDWAYSVYLNNIQSISLDFRRILLTLNTMEDGPEFAYTHEELKQIADDLISGKKVEL